MILHYYSSKVYLQSREIQLRRELEASCAATYADVDIFLHDKGTGECVINVLETNENTELSDG